ncbi:MAG: type II toxin-antitoxin system ParD family antitoxin [Acidobacteriia bacterium]|nr:type II toxin-antitoxin system ParD family antitoxin [Terriglobia bacterium]
MNITLRPDIQERIAEKVQKGEYENADALVQQALDWFLGVEDERELEETRSAVEEARGQSERGEAVAAEEVFRELRARYGISR